MEDLKSNSELTKNNLSFVYHENSQLCFETDKFIEVILFRTQISGSRLEKPSIRRECKSVLQINCLFLLILFFGKIGGACDAVDG